VSPEVVGGLRCRLGEGALWDPGLGRLLWVDIVGHRVHSLDPSTGARDEHEVSDDVGTVVVARNGRLLVALRDRLAALDPATGTLATVVPIEPDRPDTRCNDGKCDPAGRFWVGTLVEGAARGTAALYCLDAELELSVRLKGVTISNGLCWSGDGRRLYYIDTPEQRVDEIAFDAATGRLGARRVALEIPPALGAPDGMTIDVEDQLWIALWGGGAVIRVDPIAGRITERIAIPTTNVTSCAFGGASLDQLFVTTARVGRSDAELAREPLAGALFRVEVGARGVAAARFARDL